MTDKCTFSFKGQLKALEDLKCGSRCFKLDYPNFSSLCSFIWKGKNSQKVKERNHNITVTKISNIIKVRLPETGVSFSLHRPTFPAWLQEEKQEMGGWQRNYWPLSQTPMLVALGLKLVALSSADLVGGEERPWPHWQYPKVIFTQQLPWTPKVSATKQARDGFGQNKVQGQGLDKTRLW